MIAAGQGSVSGYPWRKIRVRGGKQMTKIVLIDWIESVLRFRRINDWGTKGKPKPNDAVVIEDTWVYASPIRTSHLPSVLGHWQAACSCSYNGLETRPLP